MSGHWFSFTLALSLFQFVVVQGQSMEGFISIDCGLAKDQSYKETGTEIAYISDYEFIDTGVSGVVSDKFFHTNDPKSSLRSFPNGTRNCYTIKSVIKGVKYLVRARFLYGNYDGKNKFPKFDLYFGINYWDTVSFFRLDYTLFEEIIVVVVSNSVSICLVNTDNGIPFISSIELRPIPDELYLGANTSQSLVMRDRQDFGGDKIVRYPEDTYDRSWFTDVQFSWWNTWSTLSSILTSVNEEPSSVMESLIFPETGTSLNFTYSITSAGACPSTRAYFILYFAELEKLMLNVSRILQVSVDDVVIFDEIQPEYLKTTALEKYVSFNGSLTFSVGSTEGSTKPSILNALELYNIIYMTCQSETGALDVDAMTNIKEFYTVKRNWNGDPCLPKNFTWEGLNCSYHGSNSPFITSLNLSSSGLTGGIPTSIANLSSLQYLDLSNNTLTGEVPESLSNLTQLKFLKVANNNLTGSIPIALLERARNGYLNLSAEGNPLLCTNLDSCLKGSEKNGKTMVIVVISCIVAVVLLVVLVSFVIWRYRRRRSAVSVPSSGVQSKHSLSPLHFDDKHFTFDEIINMTDNFARQIGRGGFGPVYHGTSDLGVQVAVKMLSNSSSQGVKEFQTEAKLLTRIHHRNLVPLIGYCKDDTDHLALVYEYMEGGSLQDNLSGKSNRTPLSWRDRLRIAYGAAQGLEYLHKYCRPSIVHRDVKTSNILLTKNFEARIADFGLSRLYQDADISHMSTGIVGTPGYVDPEYHNNNQLSKKSDVYSFGIVLMELITGLPAIIIKRKENIHIVQWVQQRIAGGDASEIVDRRISEDYDVNSVWKLVEVANVCTKLESVQRPDISEVVATLKDCLELSVAYEKGHSSGTVNPDSRTCFSYGMSSENQSSSMVSPDPR